MFLMASASLARLYSLLLGNVTAPSGRISLSRTLSFFCRVIALAHVAVPTPKPEEYVVMICRPDARFDPRWGVLLGLDIFRLRLPGL